MRTPAKRPLRRNCNKRPNWMHRLVGLAPYFFLVFLGIAVLGDTNDYSLALGVVPIWIWLREREKAAERRLALLREASSALDSDLLAAWCSDLEERINAEVSGMPNAKVSQTNREDRAAQPEM